MPGCPVQLLQDNCIFTLATEMMPAAPKLIRHVLQTLSPLTLHFCSQDSPEPSEWLVVQVALPGCCSLPVHTQVSTKSQRAAPACSLSLVLAPTRNFPHTPFPCFSGQNNQVLLFSNMFCQFVGLINTYCAKECKMKFLLT